MDTDSKEPNPDATNPDAAKPDEPSAAVKPDAAKPDTPRRGRAKSSAKAPQYFISEGVRGDLEFHGKAIDPANGNKLEMDETGKITVTDRLTGTTTTL